MPDGHPARVMMKVGGGRTTGMGHFYRSSAVARTLRQAGTETAFWIANDPVLVEKTLASGFELAGKGEDPEMFADAVVRSGSVAVLFDQPNVPRSFSTHLAAAAPKTWMAALDCFDYDDETLDLIVNLVSHHPTLSRPTSPTTQYREGLDYGIVREQFDEFLDRPRHFNGSPLRILVCFGGSDTARNTRRVVESLIEHPVADTRLVIVLGPNAGDADLVQGMVERHAVDAEAVRDVRSMADVIFSSDVGVIGGGTTMIEASALGLPCIMMAQNVEEARFADLFTAGGSAINLGLGTAADTSSVSRAVAELVANPGRREEMSAAGRLLVDGKGRNRIAELILGGVMSGSSRAARKALL